jgi:PPOX class probable F420-dependent enzyme
MTPEQRAFLEGHRLVVVGLPRKAAAPHLSPVYYAMDGDDIIISTTASRFKARAVRRDPRIALCILGEQLPFPYMTVYGHATIDEQGAVDVMMKVGERMTGNPVPESARPAVEQRAKDEGRVVLRVRIERFGGTAFR